MSSPTSSSLLKRRITAAIRGAFVADAASMGTHWIYDPKEMLKTVTSATQPEFRRPPSPKYYSAEEFPGHYGVGMLSPYGEQLLFATQHVAESGGVEGESMSRAMLKWAQTFGGRADGALKTFVENMTEKGRTWPDCGADDHQAHLYMKVVPVVARYAQQEELVDRLVQAIRVHQNNPQAIAFGIAAARLLEAVLLGAPLEEALKTVESNVGEDLVRAGVESQKDSVLEALAKGQAAGKTDQTLDEVLLAVSHEMMKGREDSPFYDLAGRSCALPGSFIGPIALFSKLGVTASKKGAYETALRENILASGDTCSRSVFIGAVLAAAAVEEDSNEDPVPLDWVEKVDQGTLQKVDAAIESIVGRI